MDFFHIVVLLETIIYLAQSNNLLFGQLNLFKFFCFFLSKTLDWLSFLLFLLHIFAFLSMWFQVLGATQHLFCEVVPSIVWFINSEQSQNFNHYRICPTCTCNKRKIVTVASSRFSSFYKTNSVIMNMFCCWTITGN